MDNVADPDAWDPYILGILDLDPLVQVTYPDSDPSIV
jgi:hypothetical protein